MALNGTGWQHLRRSSSPISKPRNVLGLNRETGWYSRLRRRHAHSPGMALNGTGWQHLRRSSSPISKPRNALAPGCETGWYSRRRRRLGRSARASLSGASPVADRCAGLRKMALFWEGLSAISLCLEAIRNEALRGWSELRSLVRKPRICQALCRWIPPVSSQPPVRVRGVGSPVRPRHSRVEWTIAGRRVCQSSHTTKLVGHEVRNPSALNSYPLQCCVLQISLTQTLQFGGKIGLSR